MKSQRDFRLPQSRRAILLLCAVLLCCIGLLPASSAHAAPAGQEPEPSIVYLPLLSRGATTSALLFATAPTCEDDSFGDHAPAPVTISDDIRQLSALVRITGAVGQSFRLEWSVNGTVNEELSESGKIADPIEIVGNVAVFGTLGQCGSVLPDSAHTVRLFLDDVLYAEGTATIQ